MKVLLQRIACLSQYIDVNVIRMSLTNGMKQLMLDRVRRGVKRPTCPLCLTRTRAQSEMDIEKHLERHKKDPIKCIECDEQLLVSQKQGEYHSLLLHFTHSPTHHVCPYQLIFNRPCGPLDDDHIQWHYDRGDCLWGAGRIVDAGDDSYTTDEESDGESDDEHQQDDEDDDEDDFDVGGGGGGGGGGGSSSPCTSLPGVRSTCPLTAHNWTLMLVQTTIGLQNSSEI